MLTIDEARKSYFGRKRNLGKIKKSLGQNQNVFLAKIKTSLGQNLITVYIMEYEKPSFSNRKRHPDLFPFNFSFLNF